MDIYKNEKGIALVEVIAALGIAAVVLTSMVSLSVFTLRSSLSNKLQLRGTQVASRQIELLRAYRDSIKSNWDSFKSAVTTNCVDKCCISISTGGEDGGASYSADVGECTLSTGNERITSYVKFLGQNADGSLKFQSTATWDIGGLSKSTNIYTELSDWQSE